MKKIAAIIFLLGFGMIQAQNAPAAPLRIGTVKGKVVDKVLQQPVAYAAIVIKSETGSETVTGSITDEDGSFEVKKLPEGNFLFEVQFIGYKTHSQQISISRKQRDLDLGTISLEEQVAGLEEVEVVAERSTIEQKIDRKVINVGKDLTTAGATASDIMNNLPSVNVDQQSGELTLRGNSNVRVMIDGKLSNVPVAQLLRQIPSSSIKSIELITNPSAKYNPEGMSGLVNIILHKNANIGFNGNASVGLTYEIEAKFNSTIDLNYRNGKFNLYGNWGVNVGRYVNNGKVIRTNQGSRSIFVFEDQRKSHLFKAGFDFFLNEKNTLSFFTNQNLFEGGTDGTTDVIFEPPFESSSLFQNFMSDRDNHSQQYNFDYKLDFAKEGHNIELEIDQNYFTNDDNSGFGFNGPAAVPNYDEFIETNRDQTIANLDYVNPLNDKTKLEAGIEARLFETDSDYTTSGFRTDNLGNLIPLADTKFKYTQDIYSGYLTYSKNFEKWSYQAGVRVENVKVEADSTAQRVFTDDYTEVYPSAFVSYKPSDKNQYQVSYSRRVDRPGLDQVNVVREFATPQITAFGNPRLMPQFTNSFEANYTRRFEAGSLTAGVFYRSITDEINRAVYIDDVNPNSLILTYDNFDDNSSYGFELSSNYKPTKWWNFNTSFDIFFQTLKGVSETTQVEVDNTAYNFRMNNNFKVTKKLTLSLFGFYRGQNKTIQFTIDPMYFVNTGARYSFAQGKGTFSLNFNDIFNTAQFKFDGDLPFKQVGDFNWESHTVYAGLSYRFGSGKNRKVNRKRRDDNTKQGSGGLL